MENQGTAAPNLEYDRKAVEEGVYFDLGSYGRKVTTQSAEAQTWFDRGLVWSYGFNHEEAARCFERANRADPHCCMALWGIAYALGPNYNKPWEFFDDEERETNLQRSRSALLAAEQNAKLGFATPVEAALIEAAEFRYPTSHDTKDYGSWNNGYAQAMENVYNRFPGDLDVATLYADSLMNLTPWALWDLRTGEPTPDSRTLDAKAVLDRAIAQPGGSEHPGLLHLYIHLMEMSSDPSAALPVANRLRGLVPDAGHLNHMPTHLDVLCGEWQDAITSNTEAIDADEKYLAKAGALNFYSLYRSHDYHFRIYAAMFAGQFKVALETVALVEASLPDELLRIESPPMADWLESFLSMRVHVLVRFGKWDDILALNAPEDQNLYCMTTAMLHYGKTIAWAAKRNIDEAEREQKLFREAQARVAESRTLFNNTARDILKIGAAMIDGELDYRKENFVLAFGALRKAVDLSDNLPYDEPWGWMQPPRHALGALLLERDHVEDAAAVYKADLGLDDTLPRALQHPKNVWALHGYHECLKRLARGEEAEKIRKQLEETKSKADVSVTSSCFCRLDTAA
ncbi:hypothetical protein HII31_09005 [Pseudocercospora fuligena]|uniref:TPR domain protein n=1 Tax=Pseudocercospora fuligena TaxID=685502 RepID=A0A8H6VFN7_9PEZI|nr:hypothetical protein HII31_09005 [Pseudocercospora fuligena]